MLFQPFINSFDRTKFFFSCFVDEVTENGGEGDTKPELAPLAEIFELLGNSAYRKLIESLSRQIKVTFAKNENVVDKALWGRPSDGIKKAVVIDRPFQVGVVVHQLAQLRLLEFY